MIARHATGRAVGLDCATAGRVLGPSERGTVVEGRDGARLLLSEGPGREDDRGVFSLRKPAPFEPGDVVLADPGGSVELLFRPSWRHNSLLVTQRCDSLCVMCSQPPRNVDDSARVEALIEAVRLLPADTLSVGLTGGEPSLLGEALVRLVSAIGQSVPEAGVHILSNGRRFREPTLTRMLGELHHPDLMIGIPLYADHDTLHDRIVGAVGAFDETLLGIENLARARVPIEIRVVLHGMTVPRLEGLCTFIHRNLPYVSQVVLMGLEPIGYAVPNLAQLWMDPVDYGPILERAVDLLTVRGMRARVYNVQLCTLPQSLWPFAVRSISEWKNEYVAACEDCAVRERCCGFFSSAVARSVVSRALGAIPTAAENSDPTDARIPSQ